MADEPLLVIAHRGASGYLPEHTLEAKAYAHALGAHFIEQDVVATRDDRLIVLHDIYLESVTDVAARYPDRSRDDGHFYARDFDLAEILALTVRERRAADGVSAAFPGRFPAGIGEFRVATLESEIELIQGMNHSTGREVGIYPEIKRPAWHRAEGVDISSLVLGLLDELGYQTRNDPIYLQCFDAEELRRIRRELGCELRLVQLLGENDWGESDTDYEGLKTRDGLADVATYADGIGPWLGQLATVSKIDGEAVSTGLTSIAREFGLSVHAYTFRADQLAPGFDSLEEMVAWFVDKVGIDGVFTDFPDRALSYAVNK